MTEPTKEASANCPEDWEQSDATGSYYERPAVATLPEQAKTHALGQHATGAIRESIGTKIDTTLVPYELTCAAAVGLNYGASKYAARNYEKGLSETQLLASIERHTRAIMDGETMDGDSGIPHYCLLTSSVAMYVSTLTRGTMISDLPEKTLRAKSLADVSRAFKKVENAI